MLFRSLKDPRVISITSNLPPLQKVGSFPRFRISKFVVFRNSIRASSLLFAVSAALYTMTCIGLIPHNKIEVFLFTVPHETLKFLRRKRILGIVKQVYRTQTKRRSTPSSLYLIRTATWSLQENPGSIQTVSFLVRIQARGLSIPFTENRV